RTRRPAVAQRHLLVGVRLLRARRVTRLCAMKVARVHADRSSNQGWQSEQLSLSSEGEAMTWRELRGEEAGPIVLAPTAFSSRGKSNNNGCTRPRAQRLRRAGVLSG